MQETQSPECEGTFRITHARHQENNGGGIHYPTIQPSIANGFRFRQSDRGIMMGRAVEPQTTPKPDRE